MTASDHGIVLTDDDISAIAERINERVYELIDNNNPLDCEYYESCDNMFTDNDVLTFTLVFVGNQPKATDICYHYDIWYYYPGEIIINKINNKLETI